MQAEAWTTTFSMLHAADTTDEAKLFAATTLKGKVCRYMDDMKDGGADCADKGYL